VHASQVRKGTSIPYLAHLLAVVAITLEGGGDEEQAIAALLHDVAEDQGGLARLADIRARFGQRVASLIASCSEIRREPPLSWKKRKENYLAQLEREPSDALLISLADKLHNVRSLIVDYRDEGEALWERFNAPAESQLSYYGELSRIFSTKMPGPLADEFAARVTELQALAQA